MGRFVLAFVLILSAGILAFAKPPIPTLNPALPTDSRTAFLKISKTSTILILRDFKQVCGPSKTTIDFENDQMIFDSLQEIKKRGDLIKIRALLFAAENCTEGASKTSLIEFLGVDLIQNYPLMSIRALYLEKLTDSLAASLMEAEPDELSGVKCQTPECLEKRRQAFNNKRKALESAKIRKIEEGVRAKLLAALKSDQT